MATSNSNSGSNDGELGGADSGALDQFMKDLSKIERSSPSVSASQRQIIADLQESMDCLRLSVKYLIFDLEATRRENDYLRGLLEKRENREDRD